ncbi:MAG: pyrroline-5-carboxylate reductase [Erysipelotrichaceae bacterium]|nr:pyrroline-5-carboxylate reductase [Erysipelotrichaceae bacterium]
MMLSNDKIALIGSGTMAQAIIKGLVQNGYDTRNILVINPHNPQSVAALQDTYHVIPAVPQALSAVQIIIIAVKPQSFMEVVSSYQPLINQEALLISIMAGIPLQMIEKAFEYNRVIRVMPNIALAVNLGASGYALGRFATESDAEKVQSIFSVSGIAVRVPEEQINDITALSGSGAAYICYLLEAMQDAAEKNGMDSMNAELLVRQTFLGLAKMLESADVTPSALRAKITSRKGTTDAAIRKMEELGFFSIIKSGYEANKERAEEITLELIKKRSV